MKIKECKVGMTVKGSNVFGLKYEITDVGELSVTVIHRTGDKVMYGGKMIDEVFTYKGVDPAILTLCEDA